MATAHSPQSLPWSNQTPAASHASPAPAQPPASPQSTIKPSPRSDVWQGTLLQNVRLEGHLDSFAETGNAPSRPSLFEPEHEDPKEDRRPTEEQANHLEKRENDVQGRYEHQQSVFSSTGDKKRMLGNKLRRNIQLFADTTHNFRQAFKDSQKAQKMGGVYLSNSCNDTLGYITPITGGVQNLIAGAKDIKDSNQAITENRNDVEKDELEPEDLNLNEDARHALSDGLQMRMAKRSSREIDPNAALDEGKYEKDWASNTCAEAMGFVDQGMDFVGSSVEKNRQTEKDSLQGGKGDPLELAQAGNYKQTGNTYSAMKNDQGSILESLHKLQAD